MLPRRPPVVVGDQSRAPAPGLQTAPRKTLSAGEKVPYNPRLFAVYGAFPHGGDSTAARWREQAPVLSRGGRRFAARGVGQVHRAAGLLRSEGAAGPRGAAREHGAGQALDRAGGAVLADGEAPGQAVCKEGRLTD